MSAMREKDASDYDLERFVELFDEALTSDDPRVKNALRQLMMMVILTSNEHEDQNTVVARDKGPLRRMQQDLRDMATRMHMLDEQIKRMEHTIRDFVNRPPAGYHGGMGGQPKWPNVYDTTAHGQAIGNPAITNNAIAAAEYWKDRAQVAKYEAQISDDEFARYLSESMSKEWSKKDA